VKKRMCHLAIPTRQTRLVPTTADPRERDSGLRAPVSFYMIRHR
jgi:hypothetical protein